MLPLPLQILLMFLIFFISHLHPQRFIAFTSLSYYPVPPLGSAIGQDAAFVQLSVNATIGQPVLPGSPYIINTEYGSVDDCLVNPLLPTYYMAVYRNITCGAGNPNCIPVSCKQTTRCATGTYSHPHCALSLSLVVTISFSTQFLCSLPFFYVNV